MNKYNPTPLAVRMRPKTLDDFFGQEQLISKDSYLKKAIIKDDIPSMILWGPPGSGKTTLAWIIAKQTNSDFIEISAVDSGVKKLQEIIEKAESNRRLGNRTILFIDEIHRWNKAQQDRLLPYVEKGVLILIGATTENPSFEVNSALLSRSRVFVLYRLGTEDIEKIIKRAIKDKEDGFGNEKIKITPGVIKTLAEIANGDARMALNTLELCVGQNRTISIELIKDVLQKTNLSYDKNGEEHYNLISALHKSMRGGDVDASLYYLARILEGGEDPLYVARRVVRFASEDVGLANSLAMQQAVSAYNACRFIGMPECSVNLAQAVVYMAKSKKSIALYSGYEKAVEDVRRYGNLAVPLHLRNAETKLMKDIGYGKGYKYTPKYKNKKEAKQEFFPEKLKGRKYIKFI